MSTNNASGQPIRESERPRANKPLIIAYHVLLSAACVIVHTILFVVVQVLAICLPAALGVGAMLFFDWVFGLSGSSTTNASKFFAIGGAFASLSTLMGTINNFRVGLFGRELTGVRHPMPAVEELVQETCAHLGAHQFHEIRYIPGSGAMTLHAGGHRILVIGVLTVKYLTARELAAVVAHECGHHHGGAMLPNRVHYRAFMFFRGFAMNYLSRTARYREASKKWYGKIAEGAQFSMLSQLLLLFIYYTGVRIMGWFLSHPEYEFYCDRVAAKALGANTMKLALRKVNDLTIAQRGPALDQAKANGIEWLRLVDGKYTNLRTFNSRKRYEFDHATSDTHPPLAERILRLDGLQNVPDDTDPIDTEANIDKMWTKLFASD